MRSVVVLVCAVAVVAAAHADPQILAAGALICHNAGVYSVRYDQPNCTNYFQHNPITSCDEQVNTLSGGGPFSIFVIAAFEEEKEWCGVQFGLSDYDPLLLSFLQTEPCSPGSPDDVLLIPSAGWPGPLEGISLATTRTPWTGNFKPIYWFAVYAYGDYVGPGIVQLIPDPTSEIPFGGFCNCQTPPIMFDAALGGMGVDRPGTWVCWGWAQAVCCVGTDCVIVMSQHECRDLTGIYHPEWDSCGPHNPCEPTPAAPSSWGCIKNMYR